MLHFFQPRQGADGIAQGHVTPEAIQVLTRLPGNTAASLSTWLYSAKVLEDDDETYWDICEYVKNGQNHGYGMKVKNIVRVVRNGAVEFEHDPNARGRFRMMLWHGTKQSVIAAILQNGFQLPNPKKQMFGPGLYFADMLSKSANYCDQGRNPAPGSTAFLLLCDVFLGKMYNSKNPKNDLTAPAGKFDSVMCTGKNIPDRKGNKDIKKSILPCGRIIVNTKFPTYSVEYNEYIVYDPDKIRIKYLVEVEFHSAPV